MPCPFLPSIITDAVTDLSPELLRSRNIQLLMMDFDNTIVPYTTNRPTKIMEQWIDIMKKSGIDICVVSNSKRERVKDFCRKYGIPCITHAEKPFSRGIRECLSLFHQKPEMCALVGDQIYTDTLGANLAGLQSILVNAIDNHNFWLRFRHFFELPWIFASRKRRISK